MPDIQDIKQDISCQETFFVKTKATTHTYTVSYNRETKELNHVVWSNPYDDKYLENSVTGFDLKAILEIMKKYGLTLEKGGEEKK